MIAYSKTTGQKIESSSELVPGAAQINDGSWTMVDGKFDFDYGGYTEMAWDDQCTVTRDGQRVFFDESGNEVLESDIELREE